MSAESLAYYQALGGQIALLRKARGMTQSELARAIGVSQQAVFAYENGERRISVFGLIKLATVFSTEVEELMGGPRRIRKRRRRLSPKAMRHAERLMALSKTKQRFITRIIDLLVEANAGARA